MKLRYVILLGTGALLACRSVTSTPSDSAREATSTRCGSGEGTVDGGGFLRAEDGVALWYKVAGSSSGPPVLYLHGGPGYNAYAFEKAVGALLEPRLRMIYFDQRGCGRSWFRGSEQSFGIQATVQDIERLRARLGLERIGLIGHSFGGLVALEYLRAHPDRVDRLLLVDTSADMAAALSHQVSYLAFIAPSSFPEKAGELQALAKSQRPPFEKLEAAYGLLPVPALQRQLHYASDEGQKRNESWDAESGLRQCDPSSAVLKYFRDGYLDSSHPELLKPIPVPALLFAGRRSNVIGAENIEAAAKAWKVSVRWFEHSGHFIYVEEPERFADSAADFFLSR